MERDVTSIGTWSDHLIGTHGPQSAQSLEALADFHPMLGVHNFWRALLQLPKDCLRMNQVPKNLRRRLGSISGCVTSCATVQIL